MTGLTKDEDLLALAVKAMPDDGDIAGPRVILGPIALSNFANLCRADLVAEVGRLSRAWAAMEAAKAKAETSEKAIWGERNDLQVELAGWKARALKAEQAGEVMAWGMPDALGNIVESISPAEKVTDFKAWAAQYSIPLYATPPSAVPVVEQLVKAMEFFVDVQSESDKPEEHRAYVPEAYTASVKELETAITEGQKFIKESGK